MTSLHDKLHIYTASEDTARSFLNSRGILRPTMICSCGTLMDCIPCPEYTKLIELCCTGGVYELLLSQNEKTTLLNLNKLCKQRLGETHLGKRCFPFEKSDYYSAEYIVIYFPVCASIHRSILCTL